MPIAKKTCNAAEGPAVPQVFLIFEIKFLNRAFEIEPFARVAFLFSAHSFMLYHVSKVAKFFIQIVVAVPVFLLWYAVITLIGRAFGIRLPFRGLRQHNSTSQSLTFLQHMWWKGVLGWGCGMWIITTSYDYLDWKYWSGSAYHFSTGNLLSHAVLWPVAGLLFGWMTWNARTGTAES